MKQAEVHGMSQRGGDVQSNLRISDSEIYSDLIPQGKADMIIGVEPMESLRYLNMLSKDGWLVTNSTPHINVKNYPEIETVHKTIDELPNHIMLDADTIAKDLGNRRAANIVILGAAAPVLGIPYEQLQHAIHTIFKSKGQDVIDSNLAALEAGKKAAEAQLN
jgi:indolepyruvate ferredoxin oxidoreductase beta subunit